MKTELERVMGFTVTTAKAAEIVDIGYEGLRSQLKRGLLGRSGILIPLVASDAPAPDLQNVRSKWSRFGYVDLCLMRMVKQLVDLGVDFEQANSIASREDMRPLFKRGGGEVNEVLLMRPLDRDFFVLKPEELSRLKDHISDQGSAIVVDLAKTAGHVRKALVEMQSD
jgi:hypothetical protein